MKLKICGMTYEDNILEVAKLQPDYLGFIFYEKSPRYFDKTIPKLPKTIKKVGVFVNDNLDNIKTKIKTHDLQVVQLHGQESPEFCNKLNQTDIEIIKVFSIKDTFNFDKLKPYEPYVNFFLFDTKGKLPGGNGYVFNWDILKNYTATTPYFLSGGIGLDSIENLNSFFKTSASKQCHAVDVNSKFEIKPGLKNGKSLTEFKSLL
ncbi:phosphoribosylanthranilate isomerase [Mangrovimonas cancribranchiae]|uniref:N-(5'-phosphoribosyl)anthranilate isomerase n=1 Tax=Mangrovimonas cancribranchiae TaxID=3080055 RepID=A0AAU6P3R6_9FLAO